MASTALSYAEATRNLRLDQTWDQANGGKIKIYAGTPPATADGSLAGTTLLATLTFGSPAFGAASTGTKTANAITQDSDAAATGTAAFWRATNSAGTVTYGQGSCGVTASGEAMILPTTTINQHDVVTCSSFAVSEAG
jgi:hypothetical protein